jgi:hypothetical protein
VVDLETYECFACGDELPLSAGIITCEVHFMCNECANYAFVLASDDMSAFPVSCCSPVWFKQVQHLSSPEVAKAYKQKEYEHYTSRVQRVYCANEYCRRFQAPKSFDNSHSWHTVARCHCGTNACVGCKEQFEDDVHRCLRSEGIPIKPVWLPPYTADCRIKPCPTCNMWIEHKEGCNHMTFCYCSHQFCFVCTLPWDGDFHDLEGCQYTAILHPATIAKVTSLLEDCIAKPFMIERGSIALTRIGLDMHVDILQPTMSYMNLTQTTATMMSQMATTTSSWMATTTFPTTAMTTAKSMMQMLIRASTNISTRRMQACER